MRGCLSPARAAPSDPATWPFHLAADAEWEKAARGVDARVFVWGSEFDASLCVNGLGWRQGETPNPRPVGTNSHDESVYGVRDLAGSLREWCEDWETRDRFRLVRGGSWSIAVPSNFRAAYRPGTDPGYLDVGLGFRVVRAARTPRNE